MPIRNVADRASAYNMTGTIVSNKVLDIYKAAGEAIEKARNGKGPTLLEVKSARWHGHFVGDAQKYRGEEDVKTAKQQDCIADFEKKLVKEKVLSKTEVRKMGESVHKRIEAAVEFARESPFPDASELMDDLYA